MAVTRTLWARVFLKARRKGYDHGWAAHLADRVVERAEREEKRQYDKLLENFQKLNEIRKNLKQHQGEWG